MKIHNSNLHDNNEKYSCNICGHQVSHNKSLARHKMIVHKGIRHPCRQCSHQATSKSDLVKHQRSVHEGVKGETKENLRGIKLVHKISNVK